MADTWFAQKLAPDGDTTDGCHPDEAETLKSYLSGRTMPSQAAEAITKPIYRSNKPNDDLPRLYSLLADALLELPPSTNPLLVVLLRAIEDLPPPNWNNLLEAKGPAHGQLWRALPGFSHLWADEYPSLRQWIDSGGLSKPEGEKVDFLARYNRRAEVEARLAQEGLAGIPMDWGYECVADALEKSKAEVEVELLAACKWIVIAGNKFRKGAKRRESSWGLERERDLWIGDQKGKMSAERWQFWIIRLKEMNSNKNLSEAVRDALKNCLGGISETNAEEK